MYEILLNNLERALKESKAIELIEIVKSNGATPRGVGAFMYVDKSGKSYGTIGGGTSEYDAIQYALSLLKQKKNSIKKYNMKLDKNDTNGMICGGENSLRFTYMSCDEKSMKKVKSLRDKNKNTSIVYIFGAGHIAIELAKLLEYAGFDYIIWDDRKEFVKKKYFKKATKVIAKNYECINDVVDIKDCDYVVIVTHGHNGDYIVEKEILRKKPFYVGCIGSKNKNEIVKKKLKVSGFCDKDLEIVNTPIGIQIAAETPEEIAISIVAELILYRAKNEKRKKYIEKRTLFHEKKEYK